MFFGKSFWIYKRSCFAIAGEAPEVDTAMVKSPSFIYEGKIKSQILGDRPHYTSSIIPTFIVDAFLKLYSINGDDNYIKIFDKTFFIRAFIVR